MKLNKLNRQSIKSLEQADKLTVLSPEHMDMISGGCGKCLQTGESGPQWCQGYICSETCTWEA